MEEKKDVLFWDTIIMCYSHALNGILETWKNVYSSQSASFTTREYFMHWEAVIENWTWIIIWFLLQIYIWHIHIELNDINK